jgi:hypothetical protein
MYRVKGVRFVVNRPVMLEPGLTLPCGDYTGTLRQLGFPRVEEVVWTPPEYLLALSDEQAREFGTKYLRGSTYEVTKFVKFGDISVSDTEEPTE